jgi:hypothetical protein
LSVDLKEYQVKPGDTYDALNMINNMEILGLTPNEIKQRIGHTRWTTTVDRYGNHNEACTAENNKAIADKADVARFRF